MFRNYKSYSNIVLFNVSDLEEIVSNQETRLTAAEENIQDKYNV